MEKNLSLAGNLTPAAQPVLFGWISVLKYQIWNFSKWISIVIWLTLQPWRWGRHVPPKSVDYMASYPSLHGKSKKSKAIPVTGREGP
jgi:hypothetical protein